MKMLMGYLKLLAIIFIFHSLSTSSAYDQLKLWGYNCTTGGSYTSGSSYELNLNRTLSSIMSNNDIKNGFYNFSSGQHSSKANTIALCRGDVNLTSCHKCLFDIVKELQSVCPLQKEGIGWEDECMLRYSNRSIFRHMETSPWFHMCAPNNLTETDVASFSKKRDELLKTLQKNATRGDQPSYFEDGKSGGSETLNVYGMVQCTPDLTGKACSKCIGLAIDKIPSSCGKNAQGGRVQMPSCNIRYEVDPFYNTPILTPPAVAPVSPSAAPEASPPPIPSAAPEESSPPTPPTAPEVSPPRGPSTTPDASPSLVSSPEGFPPPASSAIRGKLNSNLQKLVLTALVAAVTSAILCLPSTG